MKALVLLFQIIPAISLSQSIHLDFEHKDLSDWYQSTDGHWTVIDDDPIAGQYSLRHIFNSETKSKDWIAFFHDPLPIKESNAVWQFSIRYDFNPSSNNNWVVVLSENSLPASSLRDALVFGVNYEGNSDEIKLWRVKNNKIIDVINTGLNWEKESFIGENVSFRLSAFANGEFIVEIDTSGSAFHKIASESIDLPVTINVFALYYKYTSTFDLGLTFDDLKIQGNFMTDHFSPVVESVSIINSQTIEIVFSEIATISEGSEFCISNICCVTTDHLVARSLLFELPVSINPGNLYVLSLPGVEDLYGNISNEEQVSFYYPKAYDIVINEILADPIPPVLLPESEYIELYNRSDHEISIKEWHFTVNNSRIELPDVVISSGEYALLVRGDDFDYKVSNKVICNYLPALNNQEARLILQDGSGMLIHTLEYSDQWFDTPSKGEGGWSLEMINPADPCSELVNWHESENYRGGTPGEKNSVLGYPVVQPLPELWRAAITESGSLVLYFSRPLDSIRSISPDFFKVDQGIGNPDSVIPSWPVLNKAELHFGTSFRENQRYELYLTSDLCDCSGQHIQAMEKYFFSSSSQADSADILINEIMFDPEYGFAEYIELHNNTSKTIDLRNFSLIIGENNDTLPITQEYFPVQQDGYVIIAKKYDGIDTDEIFSKAEKIIYMRNMPSLPNTDSKIFLLTNEGDICDIAAYSTDFHSEILSMTKGVALERTSWNRSGLEQSNWHSASSDAGYKTPAARNSQSEYDSPEYRLEIYPETITPDGDGVNDVLNIRYKMNEVGYMARLVVFDKKGRKIFTLAHGNLLGTEGEYVYLGKDNYGNSLPGGYYILYFEAYHENGGRHVEKRVFVIAGNRK